MGIGWRGKIFLVWVLGKGGLGLDVGPHWFYWARDYLWGVGLLEGVGWGTLSKIVAYDWLIMLSLVWSGYSWHHEPLRRF
jgi:hypothetical protein